jgi:hypothetical protein
VNIRAFVRDNWKFVVVVTVILTVIATVSTLLLPRQYNRQLSLGVRAVPLALSENFQPSIVNPAEAPNLAVGYLQEVELEGVSILPSYNIRTQQIDVTLRSENREALEGTGPILTRTVEKGLRDAYEAPLKTALESRISVLEIEVQSERDALDILEGEIEDVPGGDSGELDVRTTARLEGLEAASVAARTEINRLQTEMDRMKQAREDPAEFVSEPVAVDLTYEAGIVESRSPITMIVLAVMVAFVVAVAAAVVRTAIREAK